MSFKGAILSDEYKEKGHLAGGMALLKEVLPQQRMDEETRKKVLRDLEKTVGEDNATDNPAILASCSLYPVVTPEILVLAEKVEHVQAVLKIANKYRVPVTPLATSTVSLGAGMFIPSGIVLDTSRMNRIIDINTDGAYALIEAGVTYGQLCKELKSHGYWYPRGSFHHAVSVLGPTTTQNHGHRGYGGWDEVCSFEVVLPDGTIVRTGGSMAEGGSWAHQYVNFPDLHGLWLNSNGMLGVITKLAVKIYPFGETSRVHLAGFDSFKTSMEFVKRISRSGMAQHQVIYWWHGLILGDHFSRLARGEQEQIGSVPFDWIIRGKEPPEGIPYNSVVTELTGYEEVVDASSKVCDRVAEELGGEPIPWEGFKEIHPGTDFLEDYAIRKQPSPVMVNLISKTMGAFSTLPIVYVGIGSPESILRLEQYVWDELAGKKGLGVWFAYSHPFDQGRCFFLRFYTDRLGEKQDRMLADAVENVDFNARILKEFGCFSHKPPITNIESKATLRMTGGYGELLERIKRTIDPNSIMSPHVNPFEGVPSMLEIATSKPAMKIASKYLLGKAKDLFTRGG